MIKTINPEKTKPPQTHLPSPSFQPTKVHLTCYINPVIDSLDTSIGARAIIEVVVAEPIDIGVDDTRDGRAGAVPITT